MMPVHSSISNSNKKNKVNIVRILFLLELIFVFIIGVGYAIKEIGKEYETAASKNIINSYNRLRFEEFYQSENIEMVFIGSSHSYCTFDPEIFNDTLGTFSYQMGMPLQHPDTSYYTLLEVLNYQHPSVVVVEVYWDMMRKDFDLKQVDTLFEVLDNDELKEQFYQKVFPYNEKVKYQIPTARFMQDFFAYKNKETLQYFEDTYELRRTLKPTIGTEYYRSLGYVFADYVIDEGELYNTNQYKNLDGKDVTLSKVQIKYLEQIVKLCKEYDMELFFVTAPIATVSMELIENYDSIHGQIKALADKNNVPYLDFNMLNQELALFSLENFRDDAHLNHSGVEIASRYYAKYLQEKAKTFSTISSQNERNNE